MDRELSYIICFKICETLISWFSWIFIKDEQNILIGIYLHFLKFIMEYPSWKKQSIAEEKQFIIYKRNEKKK